MNKYGYGTKDYYKYEIKKISTLMKVFLDYAENNDCNESLTVDILTSLLVKYETTLTLLKGTKK